MRPPRIGLGLDEGHELDVIGAVVVVGHGVQLGRRHLREAGGLERIDVGMVAVRGQFGRYSEQAEEPDWPDVRGGRGLVLRPRLLAALDPLRVVDGIDDVDARDAQIVKSPLGG